MKEEIKKFIKAHFTAVLGTSDNDNPHVCSIYYVTDGEEIYFKSQNKAQHSKIIQENHKAALAIYDHNSNYSDKKGIQLAGSVERINTTEEIEKIRELFQAHSALKEGADKMTDPQDFIGDTKAGFYKFKISKAKMTDTTGGQDIYSDWQNW